MVNIINVIWVCVLVFPVIYICTLWTFCNFLCLPYYCSHLEIVFVWASILRSSPIHSNYHYFFLHLRKCISKVWRNRKEDWSSRKRVKSQVHDKLSSPAKDIFGRRYENNCCKYILTFYICTVAGADLGGGCRGCATPLPKMTCGFLIQLVFCQKRNYVVYWCWSRAGDECTPS